MKYINIIKKSLFSSVLIFFFSSQTLFLSANPDQNKKVEEINRLHDKARNLEVEVEKLKVEVQKSRDVRRSRLPGVSGGKVSTGGYFGLGAYFDGSSLIVLQPKIHRDLGVLKGVQAMIKLDVAEWGDEANNNTIPHIAISGYVESQAQFQDMNNSAIKLNNAELDFAGWVSKWMIGYTNFGFDDSQTPFSNFEMFLGFITIGNLNYSDWFLTAGQLYAPFGYFLTEMSNIVPITRSIGRMKERTVKLGYYDKYLGHTLYLSGSVYRGKLQNSFSHKEIDQFATSLKIKKEWKHKHSRRGYDLTFSFTNNLAEADRLWDKLKNQNNFKLRRYAPGIEAAGNFTVGKTSFKIEYVNTLRNYAKFDLTQNGHAVKPRAYAYEINYDTTFRNKPITWAALYTSGNDIAVAIPYKKQYGVSTTWQIYDYTLLSAEIANRKFYGKNTVIGGNALDPDAKSTLMKSFTGKNDKIVSFTIDVYF